MRLLYTVPNASLPGPASGIRVAAAFELATVMRRRGHAVTVISSGPARRVEPGTVDGVHRVARRIRARIRADPRTAFAVRTCAAGLRDDAQIFHAFGAMDAGGLALAGLLKRRPLVVSLSGPIDHRWWDTTGFRAHRLLLEAMDRAAAIVVPSEYANCRVRLDYDRDACVLLPGIFCDAFALPRRSSSDRRIVASAHPRGGRDGTPVAIQAFTRVAADLPDIRLVFIDGSGDARLLDHIADADPLVAGRIEVLGVPSDELPDLYATATLGVVPHAGEICGRRVAELLAAGLPAVAPAEGVAREVLDDATGVLFAADDVEACAAALARGLDLAQRPDTADRCRAGAADFDWSRRVGAFEALYERITG